MATQWWPSTNRGILAVALLLCVIVAIAGAYFLGLLHRVGLLPAAT